MFLQSRRKDARRAHKEAERQRQIKRCAIAPRLMFDSRPPLNRARWHSRTRRGGSARCTTLCAHNRAATALSAFYCAKIFDALARYSTDLMFLFAPARWRGAIRHVTRCAIFLRQREQPAPVRYTRAATIKSADTIVFFFFDAIIT